MKKGDKRTAGSPETRFWSKVTKTERCWIWNGCITKGPRGGYGKFSITSRKSMMAHMFAANLEAGPIEKGKQHHHVCENKRCVRWHPDHVTRVDGKVHMIKLSPKTFGYLNAHKTHCIYGHPLVPGNLTSERNRRRCRICARRRNREYKLRAKLRNGVAV
jgi:hypothetical protein